MADHVELPGSPRRLLRSLGLQPGLVRVRRQCRAYKLMGYLLYKVLNLFLENLRKMVSSRKFELMGGRNGVPPDDVLLKNATTLGMVGWTGGPVSGKGTQCQRLSQAHGIVHISIGDVLRQEISRPESQYAETIRENMMHCKNRPQGEQLCGVILLGVSTRGKGRLFMDGRWSIFVRV